VWRVDGRTLIGQAQIEPFLRNLNQSGVAIELLGNDASFFSKNSWSLTGPYSEHKVGAPSGRQNVKIYSVRARCQGAAWRIDEFETPRR